MTTVSGEDIDHSIEIIRQRIDKLGVSEPEVSRLGARRDHGQPARRHRRQQRRRKVGTTAQLYFYDWEPNLIGPEKAIGGQPGPASRREGAKKASKKRWKDAGRDIESFENQQLIAAGAYPTAYDAALLAAEQEPATNCDELLGRPSRATTSSRDKRRTN